MPVPSISFPLETLIHRLEREGFVIGVDTHLRIQTVLRTLGKDFTEDPQSVKYILAPVIAHSPEGQQHFFEIFDEYYQQIVQPAIDQRLFRIKITKREKMPDPDPEVLKHTSQWRWLIPFIAVVILGGTALGLLLVQNLQSNTLELEPVFEIQKQDGTMVEEGDTVFVGERLRLYNRTLEVAERKLDRLGRPDELNAISFRWDFGNGSADETFNNPRLIYSEEGYFPITLTVRDSTETPPVVLRTTQSIHVVCKDKPHLLAFNIEPARPVIGEDVRIRVQTYPENLELKWGKNRTFEGSFEKEFTTFFTEEGQHTIRITGELGSDAIPGSCALLDTSFTVNIISENQPVFLEIQMLESDEGGIRKVKFSYLFTLLPTLLLMLLVFLTDYFLAKRRRGQLLADQKKQFQLKKGGPFTITLPQKDHLLSPNKRLYSLAKTLRQRMEGENSQLDISKTIKETACALGMPQFCYLTSSKASEYLILIEQSHPESHLTKLFDRLANMLKGEDVVLEIFYFDQDLRICWNEDFPDGITLVQLRQRFSRHRMLIYSDGHHMIDPFASQIADWVPESMNIWKARMVLITPVTVVDWGYKERLLSEYMSIVPADIRCQQLLVDKLIAQQNYTFEEEKKAFLQEYPETDESLTEYDFNQAEDLRIYLNDSLYEWVAATMVYPLPDWQVTLAIGRALSDRPNAPFLLTYSNLLRIARIPWMQTGLRPAPLRLEMLDSLGQAAEYISRKTVLGLLDQVRVNEDSLAAHKLNIQRISNRFLTAPGDEEIAKKMYYLWQEEKLADQALVNRMSKPAATMNGSTAIDYLGSRFHGVNVLKSMARAMMIAVIIGIATFFLHRNYDLSPQLKKWDQEWNLNTMGLTRYVEVPDSAVYLNNIAVEAYQNGRWLMARKRLMHALVYRHQQLHENNSSTLRWVWGNDLTYNISLDLSYSAFDRPADIKTARAFDQEMQKIFSTDNSWLVVNPKPDSYQQGEMDAYPDVGVLAFHLLLKDYPVAGMNLLRVLNYNPAVEAFNHLRYEDAWQDFYLTELLANENDESLRLEGINGMGLCRFYEGRINEAQDALSNIEELSPDFFEEKLPPHLRSVLAIYVRDSIQEVVRQDSLLAEAREDSIRREEQGSTNIEIDIQRLRAKLDSLDLFEKRLREQLAYATYLRDSLKIKMETLQKQDAGVKSRTSSQQRLVYQLRDTLKHYEYRSFAPIERRLLTNRNFYGREVAYLYDRYEKVSKTSKVPIFQKGDQSLSPELRDIQNRILKAVNDERTKLRARLQSAELELKRLQANSSGDGGTNPELQNVSKSYQAALNRISTITNQLKKLEEEKNLLMKSMPAAAN